MNKLNVIFLIIVCFFISCGGSDKKAAKKKVVSAEIPASEMENGAHQVHELSYENG